jgi:hypothetical protein
MLHYVFQDLDDMNIEIMRNTLYKAYLDDFYRFCQVSGIGYTPCTVLRFPFSENTSVLFVEENFPSLIFET